MARKLISEFITGSDYGPALSLEDAGLAVMISRDDGTVVLFEGEGEGRASGVCLPGQFVKELRIEHRSNPGTTVWLVHTSPEGDGESTYELGVTPYQAEGEEWVNVVNRLLEGRGGG